jgi:hypothetical protein
MPYFLCPSCHRSMLASEFIQCDGSNRYHFALCPECDACFPLPGADQALQCFGDANQQVSTLNGIVEQSFMGVAK